MNSTFSDLSYRRHVSLKLERKRGVAVSILCSCSWLVGALCLGLYLFTSANYFYSTTEE